MVRGYTIGDVGEERELSLVEESLAGIEPEPLFKGSVSIVTDLLQPPSPLRPSLRLSRSSSIGFDRPPSRSLASPSSLTVPSLTSASSSTLTLRSDNSSWDGAESSTGDESASSETELEAADNSILKVIPAPSRGVHFHARRKHFVIIPPPKSSVHRVISVQFQGSKVREIKSRKPFGANSASFSPDDLALSAKGADHIVVVRRGPKSSKIFVTIHRRENDKASHIPTRHPAQLLHDLSSNSEHSAAVLAMHNASLYLIGNQKFDHVWRLDLSQPSEGLEWIRDEHKTFPRPNTKPAHHADSPRVGFSWNNSLILVGVEVASRKQNNLQMPYSSPKPNSSRKGKKTKSLAAPAAPSQSSALLALNIWQYSILNHTWSRRTSASPPPQGRGVTWPKSLCGCLVGEDVACIALGRDEGTCVWALDLHSWVWTEIVGILPSGSSVVAVSAVGTTVYFMGDGLAPSSPIVHCDMSLYVPWDPSSRSSDGRLKSLIFPESQPSPTEPYTPADKNSQSISSSPSATVTITSSAPCAPAVLPSYGSVSSPLNPTVASFLFFTPYRILHEARDDAHFERIRNSLAGEWATCAMTLMGFIAVDAAILGLSRDGSILPVDHIAVKAIAVSILSALIGVCFTCWLYIVYYSQDGETFRTRTRDTLNTYAFFAIRARIPMLAVGVTLTSFGIFVYHCLMQIAPDVVLPIFAVSGIIMGLNAFVFVYYCVRWIIVRVLSGVKWLFGVGRKPTSATTLRVEVEVPRVLTPPPAYTNEK